MLTGVTCEAVRKVRPLIPVPANGRELQPIPRKCSGRPSAKRACSFLGVGRQAGRGTGSGADRRCVPTDGHLDFRQQYLAFPGRTFIAPEVTATGVSDRPGLGGPAETWA